MIKADEAKRAAFRDQQEKLRQSRLDQLRGVSEPEPVKEIELCHTKKTAPPVPTTTKHSEVRTATSTPCPPAPTTTKAPAPPSLTPSGGDTDTAESQVQSISEAPPSTLNPALTMPVARLGAQIKTDIGKIANQISNSSLRSLVTQYLRLVSPYFINDQDSSFPRGVNTHPLFTERCSSPAFGDVLLFHIGRAVLAYYQIEKKEHTEEDLVAIQFLHEVAVIGAGSHRVKGGPKRGFTLFAVENHDRLMEQ